MFFPIQMPRPIEKINERLDELAKLINSDVFKASCDAATKADLMSSQFQHEELLEELKAAEWLKKQYDIELSLKGEIIA
ncbi:MAG: hypothetical protein LBR53_08550 [Deltaproteobacteria bacterium]|jgi:hypothetical protein|nr:hypothetical protein [Deltaproteobacteria bacterium]